MLFNIKNPVVCASIIIGNQMIGCGLGVIEDETVGLFDIYINEIFRRMGYGTLICRSIIEESKGYHVKRAYLQVASVNENAKRLYKSMGFKKNYTYWYRVKESSSHIYLE